MAQRTIGSGGTGALTTGNQIEFLLQEKHFRGGKKPIISIEGLAGAETAALWIKVGSTWEEVYDGSSAQVSFTATHAADVLNGPGTYGFTKSATVSAITIYLDDGV